MRRRRGWYVPAVLAALVFAGGCDGSGGEPGEPTAVAEESVEGDDPGTESESETASSWEDADPCALLSDAALAEIGIEGLTGRLKGEEVAGRPVCEWGERFAEDHVELMLWNPPMPSIFDEQLVVDVDGRTAYVTGLEDSTSSCTLDVDNDAYFVKVTLEKVPSGDTPACEDTAVLAAAVLEALA